MIISPEGATLGPHALAVARTGRHVLANQMRLATPQTHCDRSQGGRMYQLHFEALVPYAPLFLRGLYVTLYLSIAAMAVGIICGLVFALARLSPLLILHILARILIDFIRGVPLLVLLIFIYYGVSIFFGIDIPAIAAAIGGLGIFYGAYLAEIFRAGILEVDKGQIEAARALGMSRVRVFRRVVLPHAFRAVLPP